MKCISAAKLPIRFLSSPSVWAAEPTYEETFNWLNEKIQESEIGCKSVVYFADGRIKTSYGETGLKKGVSTRHLVID